jgi:hypothetical protein
VEGEEEGRGLRRDGQKPALVGCLRMWSEIRKKSKKKEKKKKKKKKNKKKKEECRGATNLQK